MNNYMIALIVILITHWIADFLFQTDKMRLGKSKSIPILLSHILVYTGVSLVIIVPAFMILLPDHVLAGISAAVLVITNGGIHFFVDYYTSKATSKLWYEKGDSHNFFNVVGLDQLIHTSIYVATFWFLFL